MKRYTIIFVALFIIAGYLSALSQVSEKQKYHEPDSADLQEGSGRIILNGRLLEPPYEIVVDIDSLMINGKAVISKRNERPLVVDSTTPIKTRLAYKAIDSFSVACAMVGYDSALSLIKDFFEGFDIVDSAYIDASGNFSVKYKDLMGPIWIWFQTQNLNSPDESRQGHRNNLLINQAEVLIKSIENGNLVIIHGENIRVHLKHATKKIKQIKKVISEQNVGDEEKLRALQKIVIDSDCAVDIISNWK